MFTAIVFASSAQLLSQGAKHNRPIRLSPPTGLAQLSVRKKNLTRVFLYDERPHILNSMLSAALQRPNDA